MANSLDPVNTAPVGAVLTGSILFAQTYQSPYGIFIQTSRLRQKLLPDIILGIDLVADNNAQMVDHVLSLQERLEISC